MSGASNATRGRPRSATPELARDVIDGDLRKPLQLDEFLYQVGFAYGLPERATSRPVRKPMPRGGLPVRNVLLAVTLLLVAAATATVWWSDGDRMVPTELEGLWRPNAAQHASWSFAIERDHLVFERAPGSPPARFPILAMRQSRVADTVHYEFDYSPSRGVTTTFNFGYVASPQATVVLPVPPGVRWTQD